MLIPADRGPQVTSLGADSKALFKSRQLYRNLGDIDRRLRLRQSPLLSSNRI
jgi:hypothetical protein